MEIWDSTLFPLIVLLASRSYTVYLRNNGLTIHSYMTNASRVDENVQKKNKIN